MSIQFVVYKCLKVYTPSPGLYTVIEVASCSFPVYIIYNDNDVYTLNMLIRSTVHKIIVTCQYT